MVSKLKMVSDIERYRSDVIARDAGKELHDNGLLHLYSLESNSSWKQALDVITSFTRYELYFYDKFRDDMIGNPPIAVSIITLASTMHREGDVAIPLACFVAGHYRKDTELLKVFMKETLRTCRLMGAKYYERHKHISTNSTLIITKEVPNGKR